MNKQEAIREGIEQIVQDYKDDDEGVLDADYITDLILQLEHSQGVVIKVGKFQVLPDRIYINENNKDFELSLSALTQTDMLNAGDVKVEPLIKEDK